MARLGRAQPFPPLVQRAPVAAPAESLTLDKWLGDPPRVVRGVAIVALLVAGLVAPFPTTPEAERAEVTPAPIVRRPLAPIPSGLTAAPFPVETITVDKWLGDPPWILPGRRAPLAAGSVVPLAPPTTPSDWTASDAPLGRRASWSPAPILPAGVAPILPQPTAAAPEGTAAWVSPSPVRVERALYQRARFLPAWTGPVAPPTAAPSITAGHPSATGVLAPLRLIQVQAVAAPIPHEGTTSGEIRPPLDSGTVARRPPLILYQASAAPPAQPLQVPPNPVGWTPVVPALPPAPRPAPLATAHQQALATTLPVQPATPAPAFSWQGIAPEWIASRPYPIAVRTEGALAPFPLITPALTFSMWGQRQADLLLARPVLRALLSDATVAPPPQGTVVSIGAALLVPVAPAWLPGRISPIPQLPGGVGPIPLVVIAEGIPCILWVDDGVTRPQLVAATVTAPALITPTVTRARLVDEEVC